MRLFCVCIITLVSVAGWADETNPKKDKLSHDSEAGVILASGNSETQTYSVKQTTSYDCEKNTAKVTRWYLLGRT